MAMTSPEETQTKPKKSRFALTMSDTERQFVETTAEALGVSMNMAIRILLRRGWDHSHQCRRGRSADIAPAPRDPGSFTK